MGIRCRRGRARRWQRTLSRSRQRLALDHVAQYQTIIELENQPMPDTPEKMTKNFWED